MGKTFINQDSLPIIPIPELNETCDIFLECTKPLLTEEEFMKTKKIVNKFKSEGGDGDKLQKELISWAKRNNLSNWTAPFWYDIYLKSREPLLINSNVFYLIEDNINFSGCEQTHIATALIQAISRFKALIDNEELEVDLQKGKPICMEQYKRLFCATRIPKKEKDEFKLTPYTKHIVVLYKGNIFAMNILEDTGEMKSFVEIENNLKYIMSLKESNKDEEIGILTTMNRNEWADARASLLEVNKNNKDYIEKIDSAIFALCLDNEKLNTLEEASNKLLHGNGRNRWFDKSLQFIVSSNGKIGINIEHTGFDGSIMARLIKFINEGINKVNINEGNKSDDKPEKLEFYLNDEIKKIIKNTLDQLDGYVSNTEIRVLNFDKFGKDLIKTFNISPDAFIQLALQLAQYKLFGRCYSQYEAVMTRKFLHGRIDIMRPVSLESIEFIESMLSNKCEDKTKANLLRKAAKKQVDRMDDFRNGKAIDTHLSALINMYEIFGKNIGVKSLPELFTDKGYEILTHSTVCTSTSSTQGIALVGYGPIVEDGFGIRYLNNKDYIRFNMTSRAYMKEKLDKFLVYIDESLVEMAELMKRNM